MSDAQNQQVVDGEEQQEEEVVDLRSDDAVNKFRAACEVVNQTLKLLLKVAAEGKKTTEVADIGEQLIMKQVAAQFGKNKGMEKGPAFPVSVAVNEVVGNVSPLKSEAEEGRVLKKGDLVKIALGAHFDGYVAVGAHSFVVGASAAAPVDGPAADVMLASYYAAQAALKSIEVDKKNSDVTKAIAEVAKCYGVQPVEGVLMHQMKRWLIDGSKSIILREDLPEHHVEEFAFEKAQVYTVDVVMSTGAGKPTVRDGRVTVFKRNIQNKYQLRSDAARSLVAQVDKSFSTFPFSLRQLEDERTARLGLKECLEHELVTPLPTMVEKPGDLVAQFQYTVLVMPSGNVVCGTGLPADLTTPMFKSDKALTPDLVALVNRVPEKKKKKAAAAEA